MSGAYAPHLEGLSSSCTQVLLSILFRQIIDALVGGRVHLAARVLETQHELQNDDRRDAISATVRNSTIWYTTIPTFVRPAYASGEGH